MATQPMAEVFGFPIQNESKRAKHFRECRLCPYGNISPNCTKDKADSPLGVCCILHNDDRVITCPVRFREDWIIIENAANFAFSKGTKWTSLSEIKLTDYNGQSAGNIDYVVVSYNESTGKILDFISVEVQGVYISGNLRNAFEEYIKAPSPNFVWHNKHPHPDYLSSSRKRLVPQMLYKGGIFKAWGKKQCVVIQESFYNTLPEDVRSSIVTVKKSYCVNNDEVGQYGNNEPVSEDTLWIPSLREVCPADKAKEKNGADYYQYFTTDAHKTLIQRPSLNENITVTTWWLRTSERNVAHAKFDVANIFPPYVQFGDSVSNAEHGVVFGFCT